MDGIKQPALTVIVPIYNAKNYLKKCIESIIKQTYKNLEIILVNDGSTDGSKEICDEYEKLDRRIQVVHQENKGLLETRYIGTERAKGDYITFVDADDWIDPNMYKTLMQILENSLAEMVSCGMYRYWDENTIDCSYSFLEERTYTKEYIENCIIPVMLWDECRGGQGLDPSLCSKIYKKELIRKYLKQVQGLGIYLGEDTAVMYPMMLEINTLVILHSCYYYHRQRKKGEVAPYISEKLYFEKLFTLFTYLKQEFETSEYASLLLKQLEYFYMRFIQLRRGYYVQTLETRRYLFPYEEIPAGSRVILYGAGEVGNAYKVQNDKYHFCNIVLWVDKRGGMFSQDIISTPKKILEYEYDYIIIAVYMPELAEKIREELIQMDIRQEKIIWAVAEIHKFAY